MTSGIVDEINAPRLQIAVDICERVRIILDDKEKCHDLSMMGQSHEIHMHATVLEDAGLFAIFNSSYRQAKKIIVMFSKQKNKFDPKKSADMLRVIANNKKEKEEIEQDSQLQTLCSSLFDGIKTDFRKLQKINEWAVSVWKRYASGDKFSQNVRQWLLKEDRDDLDIAVELANNEHFVVLKNKIMNIKDDVSLKITIGEYLDNLRKKVASLRELKN
ncbi:hypothetical protein CAXC1_110008 [Candidatus Xenohaliotis californiensis]|uniref:Uncharacterized protein n=1 Tax=Candidatus Xenohaliotis californiensis TaxID=84677 RepID=A0ABM9N6V5_9RICK|nr:hypothetical protein CAXC1_110008 [Candidatus Xenohaliotis californiensis]